MRCGLLVSMLLGVCVTAFGQVSRQITFNGRNLNPDQLRTLEMAERLAMFRSPLSVHTGFTLKSVLAISHRSIGRVPSSAGPPV